VGLALPQNFGPGTGCPSLIAEFWTWNRVSHFETLIPPLSYTESVQVSVGKDNVCSCVPEERRKSPLQI